MRVRYLAVPTFLSFALLACQAPVGDERHGEEYPADVTGSEEPTAFDADTAAPVAAAADRSQPAPVAADAGAPGQDGDAFLRDEAQRLQLVRQRSETLAERFIEIGDLALERGELQQALVQYSSALDVMPANQDARERLRRVQSMLGDGYAQAADVLEDAVQRETVRRAQARLEVQRLLAEGDNLRRGGDFDAAVQRYREALMILGFHPLIAEGSLDEAIVRRRLDTAIEERGRARTQALEAERLAAEDAARREEQEMRAYRENQLRSLYGEAHAAFLRENYAQAETLARQILLLDPGNAQATEMRDIAQAARHQKVEETQRQRYREQWLKTFDDLDTMALPQTEPLVFDDISRWARVSERSPHGFRALEGAEDNEREEILARLRAVRVGASFGANGDPAPLEEVAQFLQQVTSVNFVLSTAVRDLDEFETAVRLDLPERNVHNILELIAATSESVRWRIEDGVVKFITVDEMIGGQVLRMYEVRDLISPIPDFAAPEFNVMPSMPIDYPFEDAPDREALVVTRDELENVIRENVAPDSWDRDPANTIRVTDSGTLVINQTPEVHEEIQRLLEDLRESTGIMVDINARFLKVEDNFLEDIGVDFRGLGAPGKGTNQFFDDFGDPTILGDLQSEIGQGADLGAFYEESTWDVKNRVENLYDTTLGEDGGLSGSGGLSFQWAYLSDLQFQMVLRAVSKKERVELVTAPRLLVSNTGRANLRVLNQVAYVKDFDVQIAQAASIADPIVEIVQEGVVLDVRPVVSADRRFITLELRPTVATLKRPIRTVTTSLGTQGSVTIQLPELEIQRVRTTVPMPDGGTVLLGGLKIHNEQRLESGVPILNRIPVLNFFFERKGNYISNRKLLILIKASIVIPAEHEPSRARMDAYRGVSRAR